MGGQRPDITFLHRFCDFVPLRIALFHVKYSYKETEAVFHLRLKYVTEEEKYEKIDCPFALCSVVDS